MNELTITILLLMLGAILFGVLLGNKDNKIKELEEERKTLINALNYSAKIIGESNILGVPPSEIPKEFEDK